MAEGIIQAIGVVAGVLGIISFGENNFPQQKSVESTVRVTVGLDTNGGLNNAGGDLPDVRLFNEGGEFLGIETDPGKVKDGGYGDITVKHNDDVNQQGTYALFSANNDAICIAFVSITFPSSDKYSWVGDWGHQCGGSWYYSNVYVQGSDEKPDCLWIDGNNDQPQSGFQVHWPDFYVKQGDSLNNTDQADKVNKLCGGGPPFKLYNYADVKDPHSITYYTISNKRSEEEVESRDTATAFGPSKHANSARFRNSPLYPRQNGSYPTNGTDTGSNPHANRLVISNTAKHSAQNLCDSETSHGPDFVNVSEGTFCRMSDKTVWPVCSAAKVDNCFNTDSHQLVVNGVSARDTPYSNVLDWTAGN
ncbi:uncharacterized protein F4822DRAFT_425888 [Hypoxylon trugodes]|uniref:uncharacterized protein n=1 Tax=Hypoxylon trugodes TaxID=326681 RepID=UPI002195092B|nr:uncharacterized protein F4822DRAFT_425888 [Hypoxylon trugodes]KAI1392685.1 hypothetical protein F4822DRAFT_425888 [Hypoxylon trugodes]